MDTLKREAICQVSRAIREGDTFGAISGMRYLNWITEAEAVINRFEPELKLWISQGPEEPVTTKADDLAAVSPARPRMGPDRN